MTQIIHSPSRTKAVVINSNEDHGPYWANLYVNCDSTRPDSTGLGDITLTGKRARKLATLQEWAKEKLL